MAVYDLRLSHPPPRTWSALHRRGNVLSPVTPTPGVTCDMGRNIVDWLAQYAGTTSCAQYDVGAWVIVDSIGYVWACITTGHRAAETLV